jgi:beta-lactamase regulating signal transducer with metallopeptidase domain/tetratricopeptide (TPR) repeat protein
MILSSATPSGAWLLAGWTMLHFLWAGAVLGLLAAAGRRLLRAARPNVRYAFALACLAVLAAAPCVLAVLLAQDPTPAPRVDLRPPVPSSGEAALQPVPAGEVPFPPVGGTSQAPTETPPPPAAAPTPAPNLPLRLPKLTTFVAYLPWLWLLGTPLTFTLLAAGLVGADCLRRHSVVLDDDRVLDLCRRLTEVLRVAGPVAVAVNERIASPLLVGVVRPLILLPPAALTGWSPAQLEMVLLHELAHVRRWDNLVNLGQRVVEALLFFHPVVWWVSHWVRLERECCCDALVVAHTRRPQAYARFLAGLVFGPRATVVASGMAEHHLVTRIRRLVSREDHPMKLSRNLVGLVGLLLLVPFFLLAAHAQPAPQTGGEPPAAQSDAADRARTAALLKDALADLDPDKGEIMRDLKNRTVADIANLQARLGDREGARKTLQKARALVEAMPEEQRYWEVRMLAHAYGSAGDADTVLELVKTIPDEIPNYRGNTKEFRRMVLQESALQLARSGAGEDALRVAERIEDAKNKAWVRAEAQLWVALKQAEAGKPAEALATVNKMDNPEYQVLALTGLIYFNYAFPDYPGISGIALLQAEAGDKEGAKKTLRQAADLAKTVTEGHGKERALAALACVQARLGDIDAARPTAAELKTPTAINLAAATIVKALARSGRGKEAQQAIEKLPDKPSKLHALYHCAVGQAQGGDKQGAAESFRQALALLDALDENDRQNHAHNLATSQAMAGDYEGAVKTASTYTSDSTVTLACIADSQAKAGDVKGALATADRLPDGEWWKGNVLRGIGMVQAERGDDEAALAWARRLTLPHSRGNALLGVAEGLAKGKK